MGDGEKMGKSKKRKEYSLKKIVLMVFACSSLLCLLLIIFVTRISMKAMRESKMETSLKATLEEVNQGFESEYNVLLRLSQTMTSNGLVGENMMLIERQKSSTIKFWSIRTFIRP